MQTIHGVYEITPVEGSAFFLRINYLSLVTEDQIFAGAELSEEETADILEAALIYSAEHAAMNYLARCEHNRTSLEQKLYKKGLDKKYVSTALDYLEEINYLNDKRFAGVWLRTRAINHQEGRIRLQSELAQRGISRKDTMEAINEFFSENDEKEICRKAYRKCLLLKISSDKIKPSLSRKGFTLGMIDTIIKEENENGFIS